MLLKEPVRWQPAALLTAPAANLHVAGVYLRQNRIIEGSRLILYPDGSYLREEYSDMGGLWREGRRQRYHLDGPLVQLEIPVWWQRWYGRLTEPLLIRTSPDGHGRWLEPAQSDAAADEAAATYDRFNKQEYPRLVRCISNSFGVKSFAPSLTVGQLYAMLGLAAKESFVLVLNDRNRVRQYPASHFRVA